MHCQSSSMATERRLWRTSLAAGSMVGSRAAHALATLRGAVYSSLITVLNVCVFCTVVLNQAVTASRSSISAAVMRPFS